MPTTVKKPDELSLQFDLLPAYAQYILDHQLEPFAKELLRLSRAIDVSIIKYLAEMPEEELTQFIITSTREFLSYFAANNVEEQIQISISRWQTGQLPLIAKDQVVAEDISQIAFVRKKTLVQFLPAFTSSVEDALKIVQEFDTYILLQETASFKMYINMLFERIDEHVHFIEKINNTSPGLIYVIDIIEKKEIYRNNKMEDLLGYKPDEIPSLGSNFLHDLQHPDDIPKVLNHFESFSTAKDGEIISFEHRLKAKDRTYHWIRNYESVFKRTPDGKPWQIIGIALMIDQEKKMAEELHYREEQLLEAHELAELGSYEWNFTTNETKVTEQVYKILEIPRGVGMTGFFEKVHPADKERVKNGFSNAMKNGALLDEEYRFFAGENEKIIWSRGTVSNVGSDTIMKGTVMDVTQRHHMLQKLQNSEKLYKEAQALTHIGNWTFLLGSDSFGWSDEMFRIFGLEPQSKKITSDIISNYVVEQDLPIIDNALNNAIQNKKGNAYNVRINDSNGGIKILHIKSEVRLDEDGEVFKIIGTCQDITEKQLLIEKLEESEILFKQAQALSHIGNWSWNLEDNKIKWSDEMFSIYEIEPKEFLTPDELRAFTLPAENKKINSKISDQIVSRKPHDFYYTITTKSGIQKIIHSKGEAITNEQGKIVQLIGTAQDVTEQKRIEKELFEKQNFIKKIADATPSIISSYNINSGEYSFVSEGTRKLLGYDAREVLDKGVSFFFDLIHPDDVQAVNEKNAQALALANSQEQEKDKEIIVEFQYRLKNSIGQYRWLHTYGTVFDRNVEGRVENILNISLDITDKIETETRLKEQESFTRHIAEASPTILYLYDLAESRFIYINKEVTQVLGLDPNTIIELGNKVTQAFLHPEDELKNNEHHVKYLLADGTTVMHQFEARVKDSKGNWKWLLTREIVFKRNEQGEALQVVGSALDISDRKEMEQALIHKTMLLQQSNNNLEEFAHIASHDLQEPLRKISTFGDRLMAKYQETLGADGKMYLEKMINSSQRMQQLINDILSISLIAGDKTFKKISLQELFSDVLQTLDYKIEKTNASFKVDALPEANVVPSQFRQLFQNLLGNSLKFIRADKAPVITIKHEYLSAAKAAKYLLKDGDRFLKIVVIDNGIGFDEIYAEKIFAIFQRLHGRSEYEGTGIGLSICKKIVEHHGGVIFASSPKNGGAIFTIIIPA